MQDSYATRAYTSGSARVTMVEDGWERGGARGPHALARSRIGDGRRGSQPRTDSTHCARLHADSEREVGREAPKWIAVLARGSTEAALARTRAIGSTAAVCRAGVPSRHVGIAVRHSLTSATFAAQDGARIGVRRRDLLFVYTTYASSASFPARPSAMSNLVDTIQPVHTIQPVQCLLSWS